MAAVSLDLEALRCAYSGGQLSPTELISALYPQFQAVGSVFLHLVPLDSLIAKCKELEKLPMSARGSLFGVPFAVKDNVDVADIPTTAACPAFSYVPKTGSPVVDALIQAGAAYMSFINIG